MIEKTALVNRRVWNAIALVFGAAAVVMTVFTVRGEGLQIGDRWLAILVLGILYAAGASMATSMIPDLVETEIRLCNVAALSALLALGPSSAMLVVWLGVVLAEVVKIAHAGITRAILQRRPSQILADMFYGAGSAIAIVWLGNRVYEAVGGASPPELIALSNLPPLLALITIVAASSAFLLLWWSLAVTRKPFRYWRHNGLALANHALIGPLGAILIANEYQEPHAQDALVLTLAATVLVVAIQAALRTQTTLKRRIKQLGVLGDISHRLSETLDLDEVLDTIYNEAARLLETSEFYLALYDKQSDIIDFALIVREGKRLPPQRRAMGDGLTDHIIRSRRPLLLSGDVAEQIRRAGIIIVGPPPQSYLAVPILAGRDVLGVIAVQHYKKAAAYSAADESLLETLAAQASTALQNARLYQRVRRQADHLASLNTAFTLMGASLDPNEVIEHVCKLAMDVMGAQRVGVFMRIDGGDRIRLVSHIGLSERYVTESQSILIGENERTTGIAENRPVIIPDVKDFPHLMALSRVAEREGFRAMLEVPLRIERRVIGELTVYYDEPRVFEADEIVLLSALGGQVAIAVENAHLFERTSVELAHRVNELETIEAISREMTSRLDLDAVMRRLIDAASAATDAEFIEIATLDEREQVLNSVAKKEDIDLAYDDWPADKGISGRALRIGEAVIAPDVSQDPDYAPGHPGCLSELVVPIIHGERRLGIINLESMRLDAFTKEHKRFVATLAKHAAIAIENARLFESAQRQVVELETLRSAATALLVAPNVDQALAVIAEHTLLLTGARDVHVYLYDEETGVLTFGTNLWDTGERNVQISPPRPDGLTALVARSGRMIVIDDAVRHPLFGPDAAKVQGPERKIGAIVGIPVTRGDRIIGVFNAAFREARRFSEQELHVLELLAAQAAVAIDHARLVEQIRDARDRLQAILNSTYDGILMFDTRLRLLLANPRAEYILNIRAEEQLGQTYLQIVEHLLREYGADAVGYTFEEAAALMAQIEEEPHHITRRRYKPDNPILRAVEEVTAPVVGETGEIIGRLFVLRDATQEVEIQEYREELTGMIVHDLRSPLSGIITSLDFARSEIQATPPDMETTEASLDIAFGCAERLLELVEALVEINRLSSGEMLIELAEVDMARLAEEAFDAIRNPAREAAITLALSTPPELKSLNADEGIVRRILSNLLDNALQFTPAGGAIRIDIQPYPTHQQITVTDTGPGIPEKDRERIFERFVQLDKRKRVRGAKGSGLGLTFCKLAVEAHSGRIWVDAGAEGGAAFHFTLPTDLHAPLS